jgi:hypothetical protein
MCYSNNANFSERTIYLHEGEAVGAYSELISWIDEVYALEI